MNRADNGIDDGQCASDLAYGCGHLPAHVRKVLAHLPYIVPGIRECLFKGVIAFAAEQFQVFVNEVPVPFRKFPDASHLLHLSPDASYLVRIGLNLAYSPVYSSGKICRKKP